VPSYFICALAHISICYVVRRPDRLVLSTPHGLELSNDWAIYLNSHAHGVARIGITPFPLLVQVTLITPRVNLVMLSASVWMRVAGEDLHDPKVQPCEGDHAIFLNI
jgi:hypothetical protein